MSDTGPVMARLGRVLLKQGKTVDGYAELKTAVSKPWPDSAKNDLADCHRQLGELLKDHAVLARDRGDLNTALKRLANAGVEYRRAVTLNPENSDAITGLVEVAREAVSVKPSFDNHLMLGGAYQLAGDYDRAKMEYESCWRLEPNNSSLSVARRSFHLAVVSHPRSPAILASTMEKLENSIKETPDDPELLYIYGRGKEAQEDREGALKAYEAAAAINPLIFPDLKSRIASIIGGGASSSLAGGENTSGQSVAKNASVGSKNNQGQTAALASNSASTPPLSDDMVKNLSTYAEIENKMRSNDLDGAEKIARQLVDKDPHNGKGWLLIGRIAEKKGDLDSASVSYRQAADLKEAEAKDALNQIDSSRVQPMLKEADLASAKGNWVMAAADLKDAVSLAPNLAIVHRKLAAALKELGDNKSAAKEAKKADELEKN
jgi:tetratricopeptide (TPR) repeat protein